MEIFKTVTPSLYLYDVINVCCFFEFQQRNNSPDIFAQKKLRVSTASLSMIDETLEIKVLTNKAVYKTKTQYITEIKNVFFVEREFNFNLMTKIY